MGLIISAIEFDGYTTTEMNALTGVPEGCMIWNKTLKKMCVYNGTGWEEVTSTLIV